MFVADQQTRSFPGADRQTFRDRGYTVVKQLLGTDEIEQLRSIALDTIAELDQRDLTMRVSGEEGTIRVSNCDVLTLEGLRHVLLDRRLLQVVGELLGGDPSYFGDSSLYVGKNGNRGWHRDNVDRRKWRGGPDWQDPYPLLRCGLYLQDQAHHSGGLALRPFSHRVGRRLPALPKLVQANAGDLVVWSLRTVHSGEAVRARMLPRIALHPRAQGLLPQTLRLAEDRERIVLFMSFALPGAHLDHLLDYYKTRDYMVSKWVSSRFGPEVRAEAEQAGLRVLQPTPEYGTLLEQGDRS